MIDDIDLVIFDCDGVLVDTERIAVDVTVATAPDVGWELTRTEAVELFTGQTSAAIAALTVARLGPERAARWRTAFTEAYRVQVDGIVEALDAIARPTCVASNSGPDTLRRVLGLTGLRARFAGRIFSANEVAAGKPAPDLFLHAAATLGVRPGRCVVVEDSRHGVQAARAAGMRCFGYAGGVTPAAWLDGPGTVVFDDMRGLPALLG